MEAQVAWRELTSALDAALAGPAADARWTTQRDDRSVAPGGFVLHRSGEPHAMLTHEEPLLALWGWSGDVDTPAYYV